MTAGREGGADLFGLADSFPQPGWVVLDAARDHRFTGELVFETTSRVHVYFDRGEVYLAERSTEPPLGSRLIDAGALNAAQLDHGAMQVGDTNHLGRLFERVPSIDRDIVVLMTEMMNDQCVAWVASHDVGAVTSTPYLHHPAGIHHWHRSMDDVELRPGDPLPAPDPTTAPLDTSHPHPPLPPPHDADSLVAWGEPATNPPTPRAGFAPLDHPAPSADEPLVPAPAPADSILETDWADRLETHGLPEFGSDPLAVPVALPAMPAGQRDRFELTWPSGEIDEDFDAGAALDHLHERDHDRAGPTARVVRATDVGSDLDGRTADDPIDLWDFETTAPSFGPVDESSAPTDSAGADHSDADRSPRERHLTVITDDAVQSMRRAVDSIEAEARGGRPDGRLDDTSTTVESVRADDLVLPGRVATRTESSVWCIRGFDNATNRSVFDETAPSAPAVEKAASPDPPGAVALADPVAPTEDDHHREAPRVSALRRLIGGLRFR